MDLNKLKTTQEAELRKIREVYENRIRILKSQLANEENRILERHATEKRAFENLASNSRKKTKNARLN